MGVKGRVRAVIVCTLFKGLFNKRNAVKTIKMTILIGHDVARPGGT